MGHLGVRRILVGAGALFAIACADAQQVQQVYQVGILQSTSSDVGGLSDSLSLFGVLLADHGFVPQGPVSSPVKSGLVKRVNWIRRFARESDSELAALASELASQKVNVILAIGAESAIAAKRATDAIPVVMLIQGDPVQLGLVASMGRPDANVTGVTIIGSQLATKRLELLKEAIPNLNRVAVVWNPKEPAHMDQWRAIQSASGQMNVELQSIEASSADGFERVLSTLRETGADALMVFSNRHTRSNAHAIAEVAASRRLPAMYADRAFVNPLYGGLMFYGPINVEVLRQAAKLVAQLLDGAKPAALPVEQPSKFELVINARAANALGLVVPPSIMLRADQVIE